MEALILVLVFFFGSLIGSFLNVCIYRVPKEESIAFPPSHCGSCNSRLKAKDLIPIFSYLFLRGKCRYCGERVSKQYPLIESLTGILFLGVYIRYGLSIETIIFFALTALLVVIAMIDFKTQYIYTCTIIIGIVIAIIYLILKLTYGQGFSLISMLGGAIIPALILALIVWTTNAMGWGDVELIFMVGLFLGLKLGILNLFLSIVLGGVIGAILMATKLKKAKDGIAFGPYIAIAAYFTLLWGENILSWYINTFFR